jgi:hypothetical protein
MFAELDFRDLWLDIPVTQQYYWSLSSVPPDRNLNLLMVDISVFVKCRRMA